MVKWFGLRAATALMTISTAAPALAGPVVINNGSQFTTTTGAVLHAHGAGVIKVGGYYYLLGENRVGSRFNAVSMYRSTDLKTWEFRNDILTKESDPNLAVSNVERPKVIYNAATGKYVLWAHKENGTNYSDAEVVVAISDTVDGDYSYVGEFRPLGYQSRDMTMYVDTDGVGYLISSANNNYDLNIYRLNASFTGIDTLVTVLAGNHREAPAVFKRNGVYFLVTSGATGWNPNQATYQTATTMAGPWSAPVRFGDARTYNSQPTYVLPLSGPAGNSWLFLGDRWGGATAQTPNESTYVWLPLAFPSATSLALQTASQITIDTAAGTVQTGAAGTQLATIQSASSGLCANVSGNALTYEAGVIQWDCTAARNTLVEQRASAGYQQYLFQHSGLCLAQAADSSDVVQTTCGIGARSQWTQSGSMIVNRATGRCLNVSGDSRDRGGKLITYPCSGATNSQWSLAS